MLLLNNFKKVALELDVSLRTITNRIALQVTSTDLTKKRTELLEWREKFLNSNRKQFQTEFKKHSLTYIKMTENGWKSISLHNVIPCAHKSIQLLL
ncbi:hypothetical protein J2S17_002527 [Cytobacillus purgationiresistens]|uniref:Uncharacterized protein n=1 Tax=Cytobacillus purgationiresistens TaxID=863449 RepID=A0ABU0AIQ5_9BACI|nr:hypothetical protein [Cytobacillus purgationiresistens]